MRLVYWLAYATGWVMAKFRGPRAIFHEKEKP
jgi:hypothetical protein